jgi:hypothetical protein
MGREYPLPRVRHITSENTPQGGLSICQGRRRSGTCPLGIAPTTPRCNADTLWIDDLSGSVQPFALEKTTVSGKMFA